MSVAGLQEVDTYTYISHHQNIVTQYITNIPIMNLCLAVDRHLGKMMSKKWWDQESLDLKGMQTVAQETGREEGKGEEVEVETEI